MQSTRFRCLGACLPCFVVAAVVLYLVSPSLMQPKAHSQDESTGKATGTAQAGKKEPAATSYDQLSPLFLGEGTFQAMMAKDKANKEKVAARQRALLAERYDLSLRVDQRVIQVDGVSSQLA